MTKKSNGVKKNTKDTEIELMTEIGWIKNKEEADLLVASTSSNNNNVSEEINNSKNQQSKKAGHDIKSASLVGNSQNRLSVGAYDPKAAAQISNPFFANASFIGGALLNGEGNVRGRRGAQSKKKKGAGAGADNKRSHNQHPNSKSRNTKTYIYK